MSVLSPLSGARSGWGSSFIWLEILYLLPLSEKQSRKLRFTMARGKLGFNLGLVVARCGDAVDTLHERTAPKHWVSRHLYYGCSTCVLHMYCTVTPRLCFSFQPHWLACDREPLRNILTVTLDIPAFHVSFSHVLVSLLYTFTSRNFGAKFKKLSRLLWKKIEWMVERLS